MSLDPCFFPCKSSEFQIAVSKLSLGSDVFLWCVRKDEKLCRPVIQISAKLLTVD